MTDEKLDGANEALFFDEFNKGADKQAVTEEVNRKLCEVLTELAEDIVDGLSEQLRAAVAEGSGEGDGADASANGAVDEVAALAAYNDALAAIMREKDFTSKDMCSLPDDHPLKELFFSAFDHAMFHDLLRRFIGQVRARKQGPGEWDAEAAEGECDEDHTLE
ncbi:hypothetical protein GPECTOR_46g243 [Gonium pectorale]|uniref:BART domain-containing protein n=1 Tax=Gonium pectorale TaxID=33097 RepID=A0A150G8L4_GONPE|nr:hypothetical protein GPECTOR_46g243 [Gonium pectorale]|eukprot:KXZ46174.1 hypothetical protein GPECTOR_46g243 [Gonium pectorale]